MTSLALMCRRSCRLPVTRTKERLAVARAMYGMRFSGEDVSAMTMQQRRSRE
ncbi:hypothetical protein NE236_23860 [Actinoallomurus purpureus]|uniref:hypothetical protein n=1 Tax=Actinoallomurus purpureus TaxID=478114 RepID=UPI0020922C43|nr:hypothetical protein [Actinoallomurus purpureus]MCO6008019.1 hypothetical protein [Actinoallomurus purpureus]